MVLTERTGPAGGVRKLGMVRMELGFSSVR